MDSASAESLSIAGLFASSFLSATLLPGNSEIVLLALLHQMPALKWTALVVATVGNTLGEDDLVCDRAPRYHFLRRL